MQAEQDSPQSLTWLAAARVARTGLPLKEMGEIPAVIFCTLHEAKRTYTFPVTSRMGADRAGECAVECLKGLFMERQGQAEYYIEALQNLITDGWAPYEKDRDDIRIIIELLIKKETRFGETALNLAYYFAQRAWQEDRFTLQRMAEECAKLMYIIQATSLPWWCRFTTYEKDILHFVEETRRNLERSRTQGRWIHIFNDVLPAPLQRSTRIRELQRDAEFAKTLEKAYRALARAVSETDMSGIEEAEELILAARKLAPLGGWWGHHRNRLARLVKLYQETEALSFIEREWQDEIDQMLLVEVD